MSDDAASSTEGGSPPSPTPADDEVDPLVGTVIADRYRVDERLGVGGMGAVYRAEHVLMRKPVAVKVLHREMTVVEEVVKRFEREAIVAGRIDHPNVTVATDFGKLDNGAFYLVLEYVPGRSLTRVLEVDGRFSCERALFVARQIAAALGAAHAAGIVHRDLKPDNVMLIERGGTKDFVKVLDFGIAKIATEGGSNQLTRLGSVFGTPAYMSPEQAAGQTVDARSDLYSLGLVLYEMLAGHAAFESEELVGLLAKQLTEPPPPLPEDVPAEVSALVMALLVKDPAGRPQASEEIIAAIDALLGPAALPPDSTVLGVPSARGVLRSSEALQVEPASGSGAQIATPGRFTLARARAQLTTLVSRAVRGETVLIARRDVPLWLIGAAVGAVVMGVVLVLGGLRAGTAPGTSATAGRAPPAAPDLAPLLARAVEGDRVALQALEARPVPGRTPGEWRAIALGHSKLSEHRQAAQAGQQAVLADPSLASDVGLLGAVRRAADDDASRSLAFELCTGSLGAGGADVLFDVWASTSEKTETTVLAKASLDREEVRSHASKPLRLALDLRRTTRCDEVKRLVAEAREVADERAFRPLNQLNSRKGCGFLRFADCYPCLRQGDSLAEAIQGAQSRQGPRF